MTPSISIENMANCTFTNIEFFCNYLYIKFHSEISNLAYFFRRKFCFPNFFTSCKSSFSNGVFNVLFLSASYKVFRIYARRVIAFMKNNEFFRNFTYMDFIRNSMGLNFSRGMELPVPSTKFSTCPQPTSRSFFDVFEEAFGKIFSHRESPFLGVMPPMAQTMRRLFVDKNIAFSGGI